MVNKKCPKKIISIGKHKFTLEIYPARECYGGYDGPYWEIFPHDYEASLYAFSNKEKIKEEINNKYMEKYEPTANNEL